MIALPFPNHLFRVYSPYFNTIIWKRIIQREREKK